MKRIFTVAIIFISYLYGDFTITYLINNQIKQTVFYKDAKHVLFEIESNNTLHEKLIISNSKKYLTFIESGIEHIYEISDELSQDLNSSSSSDLNFKIVKKEGDINYLDINATKWLIEDKDGKKEEVIVTNDIDIYDRLHKTIEALKQILPASKEREATIFDMGNGYILLKSRELKFLSQSTKDIELSMFTIDNGLNKKEQKELAKNIDKCFKSVCCGNRAESSQELFKFLKESNSSSWKLLAVANCKEKSQKELESAVFKGKNSFVTIEMTSKNSISGKIDSLKDEGIELQDLNSSKINGYEIKIAYIPDVNATVADITLPNTTISLYTKGKENLKSVAKEIIKFNLTPNYTLGD